MSTQLQYLTLWKLIAKLERVGYWPKKNPENRKSSIAIHGTHMLVKIHFSEFMTAHLSSEPLRAGDTFRKSRKSSWSGQILKAKIWALLKPVAKFILTLAEPRFYCHLITKSLGFHYYCLFSSAILGIYISAFWHRYLWWRVIILL